MARKDEIAKICSKSVGSKSEDSLTLKNFNRLFVIYAIGIGLGIIAFLVELVLKLNKII